jgi:hypothetical protein
MATTHYPLTHRALVCTRMDMFKEFKDVNALSSAGPILPPLKMDLETTSEEQAQRVISFLFPVLLHNLLRAQDFPLRKKLAGALDTMEQNIKENSSNTMIKELLACGLKGTVCDPAGLPANIDAKRAVALYLERGEWDTLYRTFYLRVTKTFFKERKAVAEWLRAQEAGKLATA